MHIINLTEIQYKNYSRIHSKRNYFQSIEFANMQNNNGYNKIYVGLIDKNNNLVAASLILGKRIFGKYLYGYVPGGFLIDYNNYNLLKTFTNLLQKYLFKLNYIYITVTPEVIVKKIDKNNNILYNNDNIINNIERLGFKKSKKNILNTSILLETNNNINDTYNNLSRFIKRNIRDNKLMGISVYKSTSNDINEFYSLIRKKTNYDIKYYTNYFNYFNNDNNRFEIYYAFLDTNLYLSNYNDLLTKEKIKNDNLKNKILNLNIKNKNYYINKKINSDKLIEKYTNEIKKAINLNNLYRNGIIVATSAIIKTNNRIYFIIDGYEEKIRNIRASNSIKWEIIKKYSKLGYKEFNLGLMPKNKEEFNGLYLSKLGFNSNIVIYPDQYHLIINSLIYNFINLADNNKYS